MTNEIDCPSPSEKYKQDKKEEYTETRHIEESKFPQLQLSEGSENFQSIQYNQLMEE